MVGRGQAVVGVGIGVDVDPQHVAAVDPDREPIVVVRAQKDLSELNFIGELESFPEIQSRVAVLHVVKWRCAQGEPARTEVDVDGLPLKEEADRKEADHAE